ncbi:hypothetical protein OF83DRAFT_1261275 [Amylostereum chailletii]|nr:hypothetical protein OF83DRAFT_1261275 [Amylostereum chailletii]
MPGVSILPATPSGIGSSFTGVSPAPHNGSNGPTENMTVAEIKERAIQQVHKHSRGFSALTLIRAAKDQIASAERFGEEGDLKSSLGAYTKAASLMSMCLDSAEFKAERVAGVLHNEVQDFQQREGRDLTTKAKSLEAKLTQLEQTTRTNGHAREDRDSAVQKTSGGSIADRMRSLQDAGLTVSTTKRISREIPTSLTTPLSPTSMSPDSQRPHRPQLQGLGLTSPTVSHSASLSLNFSNGTPPPAAHTFVSPSTLAPPSPTSSTSSSPRAPVMNLSEFSQTFPSIDELEEVDHKLPPTSTGTSSSSRYSPTSAMKSFPVLPLDLGQRPASTPITPIVDHFASRPASPSKQPLSPTKLIGVKPSRSPLIPQSSPPPEKPELPVKNTLEPSELREYLEHPHISVLLLDVRTREAYEREHIRADAIVCIEPYVLQREHVTGQSIEDSLAVAPRHEATVFSNRDKFDLIAIYDDNSKTFGHLGSPLSSLVRAVYENAFRKILKNVPILLLGGFEAWKREGGDVESHVEVDNRSQPPSAFRSSFPDAVRASDTARSTNGRSRADTDSAVSRPMTLAENQTRMRHTREHASLSRSPEQQPLDNPVPNGLPPEPVHRLVRKPAMGRPPPVLSTPYQRNLSDSLASPTIPQPLMNGSPIQYPHLTRIQPNSTGSFGSSPGSYGVVSPPPQASINSSPLSRRRSDYMDQSQAAISQAAMSGLGTRSPIDYPDLPAQQVLRPPPIAASSALERKERPRIAQHGHSFSVPAAPPAPAPPTIQSYYPVTYWGDLQIGTTGLKNLGNTCYMNATIQCLNATVPFARFFIENRWGSAVNMVNPLSTKGAVVSAFANILRDMVREEMTFTAPNAFRHRVCQVASQFAGSEQHDSQEFLSFLLDGLHEDLNRIMRKSNYEVTPEREAELELLPPHIASDQEWKIYRMRDDSIVVDYFQGQLRNRLECMTCHKTSTTYNTFMYLSLPVPTSRVTKASLTGCLDAFVKEEVMEKSDAWHCPRCGMKRRATKKLSLARLPPVLLIHLKRFSFKGPFTDKIEKLVDFPLKGLDLTDYMPPPLPIGADKGQLGLQAADDPRLQVPPYKYDLYGVTNHFGSLSSGHYTAFVASRGRWLYCDDSRVAPSDAKEVVGKPAYVLYYKRVKT